MQRPDTSKVIIPTESKPHVGGPASGMPPAFLIGSGLQSQCVVGIDVGNARSRVATVQNDRVFRVCRVTDSVLEQKGTPGVHFLEFQNQTSGILAFARNIKANIGSGWRFQSGSEIFTAESLFTYLLKSSKIDAQNEMREVVQKCVLTVPASFDGAQRALVKAAADDAGLHVLHLINEPSAVALSWCVRNLDSQGLHILISAGQASSSVLIFKYSHGIIEVQTLASCDVGAEDFDRALSDKLVEIMEKSNGLKVRLDSVALEQLRRRAECARLDVCEKQIKSYVNVRNFAVQSIESTTDSQWRESVDLWTVVDRPAYDAAVKRPARVLSDLIADALYRAGLSLNDFDTVLTHGNFGNSNCVGSIIDSMAGGYAIKTRTEADDDAAFGAALQARLITTENRNLVLWDVLSKAVEVGFSDGSKVIAVKADTPLPVRTYVPVPSGCRRSDAAIAVVVSQYQHRPVRLLIQNCPPEKDGKSSVEFGVIVNADGTLDYVARHIDLAAPLSVVANPVVG